ncbi:hypothetical protein BST13_02920 [Mycobacterium aquaticum]|uniref:Uncharacterized protein n=1 Tax=Mycobacterium aquaticum TaxID=1927124 RepID=A0A1X0BA66_9MYCO|nr:hypothetical protein BST13_02920 [Mycobacterium aquaticum]
MKNIVPVPRVKASADGGGVVSHAGMGMLRMIGFGGHRALAHAEISTFRYRVLNVAARLTRTARQRHLRIDATTGKALLGNIIQANTKPQTTFTANLG